MDCIKSLFKISSTILEAWIGVCAGWFWNTFLYNTSTVFVNATALFLAGQGTMDFQTPAIQITNNSTTPTGDILFSTHNFVNGDSYSVILEVR